MYGTVLVHFGGHFRLSRTPGRASYRYGPGRRSANRVPLRARSKRYFKPKLERSPFGTIASVLG